MAQPDNKRPRDTVSEASNSFCDSAGLPNYHFSNVLFDLKKQNLDKIIARRETLRQHMENYITEQNEIFTQYTKQLNDAQRRYTALSNSTNDIINQLEFENTKYDSYMTNNKNKLPVQAWLNILSANYNRMTIQQQEDIIFNELQRNIRPKDLTDDINSPMCKLMNSRDFPNKTKLLLTIYAHDSSRINIPFINATLDAHLELYRHIHLHPTFGYIIMFDSSAYTLTEPGKLDENFKKSIAAGDVSFLKQDIISHVSKNMTNHL